MNRLYLGSDHGGFTLKSQLLAWFAESNRADFGGELIDLGCYSQDSVDYPAIAQDLCRKVLDTPESLGILICGTGIGMSIAANRFAGIRAALCHDEHTARMSRQHNDANVLVLGGRILSLETAAQIVYNWLSTPFEGGRHTRRIAALENLPIPEILPSNLLSS